ncbi:PREDICTED: rRNA-processing protein UTP23 homolog [Camelina sativa]|uniref:rRNA-processing protein UTP23 homolog n=1 Tax=Camelina sativa TaxID=90675 RepID=A0ABM0ZJF4_CAMSA|nr:PREDICTED: rRNA-processing protein UTP23 homolog [Camelina sativa]
MRVKRQKKNRRTVRFFTVCFGFRQPFKVLCDGNFIHHLVAHEITPADTVISDLLGGPVKLFTTRCVVAELEKLGKDFSESLEAAQMLSTATCEHEEAKAADECLSEVIGLQNTEHFFLGTQDADFRRKLQQESIVPLVFGLRNILLIDQPSDFQRETAKDSEKRRLNMTDTEKRLLAKRTSKIVASNRGEGTIANEEWGMPRVISTKNPLGVKDRPQFKRNRAKGPNPLSCMKKKKDNNTERRQPKSKAESNTGAQKEKKEGESDAKKRTRKRSKKEKSGPESTD